MYEQKVLNFISLLKPIYSSDGVDLWIRELGFWKAEMFALMASLIGKVKSLTIDIEMGFAEFFLVKKLFMKNALYIGLEKKISIEVSFIFSCF